MALVGLFPCQHKSILLCKRTKGPHDRKIEENSTKTHHRRASSHRVVCKVPGTLPHCERESSISFLRAKEVLSTTYIRVLRLLSSFSSLESTYPPCLLLSSSSWEWWWSSSCRLLSSSSESLWSSSWEFLSSSLWV